MRIIKLSSATMSEEEWKYGPVYSICGNTFSIKTQLNNLGFSWSSFKRCWYMPKNKFPSDPVRRQSLLDSLRALGVAVGGSAPSESPSTSPLRSAPSPSNAPSILHGEEYPLDSKLYNEEKVRARYSFPIEKNIYSFNLTFDVDGEEHTEPVTISRYYRKGKTSDTYRITFNNEYRDYPVYEVSIGNKALDNEAITKLFGSSKLFNKKWGTYDEKEFIENDLVPLIRKSVEKKPASFKMEYDYRKHTPELLGFLSNIESQYYSGEKNVLYDIVLDRGLYKGEFPVSIHYSPPSTYNQTGDVTGYPAIEHEKAKQVSFRDSLFKIELYKIHTIKELDTAIAAALESDEAKDKYVKYLESFPYADASSKEGFGDYSEIASILENPSANVDNVISKLREKGYVRPNQRKKGAEIPDSKKILNDFYRRGEGDVDFFYTFIAYQLHYLYKNYHTRSFISTSYIFDIYKLYSMLEKYGEVDKAAVLSAVEKLSEACYSKLFGQREKSTWENYNDFYGRGTGTSGTPNVTNNALYDLKEIADENGIDISNIENDAYSVYRQLARLFHPDLNPNNPDATSTMQMINGIWDNIPTEYKQKRASTWYSKWVFGE